MKAYKSDFKYKNDLELLDLILYLYSKTVLKTELSEKRRIILREYLLHGYSKTTKDAICTNLKMTKQNLNTQNCTLQALGFLHPHLKTQRLKTVDVDLIRLRDTFLGEDNKKCFIVDFLRV